MYFPPFVQCGEARIFDSYPWFSSARLLETNPFRLQQMSEVVGGGPGPGGLSTRTRRALLSRDLPPAPPSPGSDSGRKVGSKAGVAAGPMRVVSFLRSQRMKATCHFRIFSLRLRAYLP